MNLVASLVVRNELARYLAPCIDHLLAFCDRVLVLDDDSDDGTREWLAHHPDDRVHMRTCVEPRFFVHEGRTRHVLLDFTLEHKPDCVLSIDADEFVSDGAALRARVALEPEVPVWSLGIEEVWRAGDTLRVREDGGWRSHPVPVLWRVEPGVRYAIMDRKLACRRVPTHVLRAPNVVASGVELLHFGWTDERERAARHARYVEHDGGRFHARAHLASILWGDERVVLREREWPEAIGPWRAAILDHAAVKA